MNFLILIVCVFILWRVWRRQRVHPCKFHPHELTHTNTLVSVGAIREAKRTVLKTAQMLAPHEVGCNCDERGAFEWHVHDPTCPRYQVGIMLKGQIERVR